MSNDTSDLSHEERVTVTHMVLTVLDDWDISHAEQIILLALPGSTRTRALRRHQQGEPLPDEPAVWRRIEHLMGIVDALRTSYPRNNAGGGLWMKRRNPRFNNRTPLETMLEDGDKGVLEVRIHLDCAYDWHIDTRKP